MRSKPPVPGCYNINHHIKWHQYHQPLNQVVSICILCIFCYKRHENNLCIYEGNYMGYISGQPCIGNFVLKIHEWLFHLKTSQSTNGFLSITSLTRLPVVFIFIVSLDGFSCFLINRYAINPTSTPNSEAYPVSGLEP